MSQAKKAKTGGTKVAVVTTTIYVPKCLDDYFANAVTYGHSDTLFVVTGDTKTPAEAKSFCAEASARHGVNCVFMDVEDQKAYMSKVHLFFWLSYLYLMRMQYPEFDAHLPWRCIQRRNVSILYAYEQGCDVIIAIDDDNYVLPGTDFVGTHLAGLSLQDNPLTSLCSSSGWLNVCKYLKDHRGAAAWKSRLFVCVCVRKRAHVLRRCRRSILSSRIPHGRALAKGRIAHSRIFLQ